MKFILTHTLAAIIFFLSTIMPARPAAGQIVFRSTTATKGLSSEQGVIDNYNALRVKLDSIAEDPKLAQGSQDYLFRVFATTSDYKTMNWMRVEETQARAIGILGGLERPEKRIIRKLVSLLSFESSRTNSSPNRLNAPIVMTLGRLGPAAIDALPALKKLPSGQGGVAAAIDRISGRDSISENWGASPSIQIWKGSMSRIDHNEILLIRNQSDWTKLWQRHAGNSKVPNVDFSTHCVIALFHGASGSIMQFNFDNFEQSASLAKLTIYAHYTDAPSFFPSYPFLFVEIPRLSIPLTVIQRSVAYGGGGERILDRFSSDGQRVNAESQGEGGKDPAQLSGTVHQRAGKMANNAPMSGIDLVLDASGTIRHAISDEQGKYKFDALPPGEYTLRVVVPKGFKVNWSKSALPENEFAKTIRLEASGRLKEDFMAIVNGTISGHLLDHSGHMITAQSSDSIPSELELISADPPHRRTLLSADVNKIDGSFMIDGIPEGRYFLTHNAVDREIPDEPFPTTYYPGTSRREKAVILTLHHGEHIENLTMRAGERLRPIAFNVEVTSEEDKPLKNTNVSNKHERVSGRTDPPISTVKSDIAGHAALTGWTGDREEVDAIWNCANGKGTLFGAVVHTFDKASPETLKIVLHGNCPTE